MLLSSQVFHVSALAFYVCRIASLNLPHNHHHDRYQRFVGSGKKSVDQEHLSGTQTPKIPIANAKGSGQTQPVLTRRQALDDHLQEGAADTFTGPRSHVNGEKQPVASRRLRRRMPLPAGDNSDPDPAPSNQASSGACSGQFHRPGSNPIRIFRGAKDHETKLLPGYDYRLSSLHHEGVMGSLKALQRSGWWAGAGLEGKNDEFGDKTQAHLNRLFTSPDGKAVALNGPNPWAYNALKEEEEVWQKKLKHEWDKNGKQRRLLETPGRNNPVPSPRVAMEWATRHAALYAVHVDTSPHFRAVQAIQVQREKRLQQEDKERGLRWAFHRKHHRDGSKR